jgi:hypothetical protein
MRIRLWQGTKENRYVRHSASVEKIIIQKIRKDNTMARTAWRVRVRMQMRMRLEEYGIESANGSVRMEVSEWKCANGSVQYVEYSSEYSTNGSFGL